MIFFSYKDTPEYKRIGCLFNPLFDYELAFPSDRYDSLINPMEQKDGEFRIHILNNTDDYKISITQTNKYYSEKITDVENYYNLVFSELSKYVEQKKSKVNIADFLKSFALTSTLDNVFSKTPFIVEDGVINFLYDDMPRKFIHMCEFYIDEFRFNCSGSYMFFENMLTQEQYMYYGD